MNGYLLAILVILSIIGAIAIPPLVSPDAFDALMGLYDWLSEHILQVTMAISVVGMVYAWFTNKTVKFMVFAGMLLVSILFRM